MSAVDDDLRRLVAVALGARRGALVARDPHRLASLLHPDFVYTNASGRLLDVGGYLDLTVRGPLRWHDQVVEPVTLTRAGGVLVLTGHVVDRVQLDGEHHEWRFATTQVYLEEAGALLYLAGHTGPAGD
ncbi:nuclear transport factor 2 family protein [Nocardioides bigeumensis]|uniref:DUF4440 domain-containing protein n=1 Tax=Nocardioides bigeumensis TaxID=433657 RepID=A0ABN2YAB1_9ACTN